MGVYAAVDPVVLLGLAAQEFASKLQRIEQLNLTPDMLTSALSHFARNDGGTAAVAAPSVDAPADAPKA